MTDLRSLTLEGALKGLNSKEFSAVELTDAHIDAVDKSGALNAYTTQTPDQARAMAQASDDRRAKGDALPLDGAPLAIKSLFATKGVETNASSNILRGFNRPMSPPSPPICGRPAP